MNTQSTIDSIELLFTGFTLFCAPFLLNIIATRLAWYKKMGWLFTTFLVWYLMVVSLTGVYCIDLASASDFTTTTYKYVILAAFGLSIVGHIAIPIAMPKK